MLCGRWLSKGLVSPVKLGQKTDGSGKGKTDTPIEQAEEEEETATTTAKPSAPPKYAHKMVRTDASMGNLRQFLYSKDDRIAKTTQSSTGLGSASTSQPGRCATAVWLLVFKETCILKTDLTCCCVLWESRQCASYRGCA